MALAPRAQLGMQPPVSLPGPKTWPAPPDAAPVTPSQISPKKPSSSAPSTPQVNVEEGEAGEEKEKKKERGEAKKRPAKDLAACGPLERGENLRTQILKKKGECAELETQIKTLQFGSGLAQELQKFQVRFESSPQVRHLMFDIPIFVECFILQPTFCTVRELYGKCRKLVGDKCDDEASALLKHFYLTECCG